MKIKELDITGFKSFVDSTTLVFQPGITTIVGPNGCGKSNIVDAIRWAMGEQSPRHLRGKDMEDVIFVGSEGRKSLGMAEVSILFSNEDGNAPEEYREYGEIMVTRRLFRSGESEYLINKVPCRLKDITELFMGTGVGTRAYSIVEQGQIGLILNSKPQERRFLIEEAAGITKYKSRKREALAKMESTEQNLQRVNDVIGEVRRQMNALDRQARKAERFRGYRAEMREIELKLYSHGYAALAEGLLIEEEKLRAMEEEGISMETRARGCEAEIEALKGALMADEGALKDLQERFYRMTGEIQKKEDRIEYLRSRRDDVERQGKRHSEEIEQLKADRERAESEITSIREEIRKNSERQGEVEERLREKEEELRTFSASYEEKGMGLDAIKAEMVRIASEIARSRNTVSNLEKRVEEIARRAEKGRVESEGLLKRVAEVKEEVSSVDAGVADAKSRREALAAKREALVEEINSIRERRKVMEQSLRGRRDELSGRSSHLNSLEELNKRFEGYADGVRAIKLSENSDRYTVVSDIFETSPEFETPLEAALEGRLQYLIVHDLMEGIEGIGYLKSKGSGRCGFLPATPPRPQGEACPESHSSLRQAFDIAQATTQDERHRRGRGEGSIPLLEVVRVRPGYEEAARFLLGNTHLIDSLEKAVTLSAAKGLKDSSVASLPQNDNSALRIPHSEIRFVTPDGDVIEPSGTLIGGSKEVSGHGILQRKREMKGLREEVDLLKGEVQEMEDSLKSVADGITDSEDTLETVNKELHQVEIETVHLEKDGERHSEEIRRLTQRLDVMRIEEEHLLSDREGFEKELLSESERLRGYSGMKEAREISIRELQEGFLVFKGEMDRVNAEVTDLKVSATSFKGRVDTLKATMEKVVERREELLERASLRGEEIAGVAEEMAGIETEIYELKKGLKSVIDEKERMEEALTKAREAWQAGSERLKALDGERQRVVRESDALRKEMNSAELAVSRLRMDMGNLSARVSDGYNTTIEEAVGLYRGQDLEDGALNARRDELGRLLGELGEVNLTAIEEFQSLEERHRFLSGQHADLSNSLESLQTAIQKINRISRERFHEAFEAVNANFRVVFQRLFKGGKAEMVLTDSDDLLEAGIDIIAQPPGKKLQGVSLLSGGEKALTAVSLIFSIFLMKPTPFCLLDEVDAPLDDANVGRFNEMVMEMSRTSQFILITHNKVSMEIADVLYGVTMQEPGVSKMVSVRLREEAKAA